MKRNQKNVADFFIDETALIIASVTLESALRTSRRGRQINGVQNRRKHRARLLTEKALRSRGAVRPGEEKVRFPRI
jgi:hypothetical protein